MHAPSSNGGFSTATATLVRQRATRTNSALIEWWILHRHRYTCASAGYPHQQPTSTANGSDHPRVPVAKQ